MVQQSHLRPVSLKFCDVTCMCLHLDIHERLVLIQIYFALRQNGDFSDMYEVDDR